MGTRSSKLGGTSPTGGALAQSRRKFSLYLAAKRSDALLKSYYYYYYYQQPNVGRLPRPSMHHARSDLFVLGFADPQLVERPERGKDGAAQPRGILALDRQARRRQLRLDLHPRVSPTT
jgi:hypothetical protein